MCDAERPAHEPALPARQRVTVASGRIDESVTLRGVIGGAARLAGSVVGVVTTVPATERRCELHDGGAEHAADRRRDERDDALVVTGS